MSLLEHAEIEPMATGPEPRVLTEDVRDILQRVVKVNDDAESSASVASIAERAETSTRTVYRVLSLSSETLNIDLADRLVLAANSHLALCRLKWPDGRITAYF